MCSGLAEEARTAELWGAPYALLVHDSSKAQALEYANQQVRRKAVCGWLVCGLCMLLVQASNP